jgi:SSS family transporter
MVRMITLGASGLGVLDWTVIGGYLALLLVSGIWFARREPSGAREYFIANRRMPAWAVSFSVIASALSVATFIGVPESVFKGNMTFLSTTIGTVIAVAVVAGFFIPAFYAANVTTVYDLLERRYGAPTKKAASAAFMVGRVFASGARVYIAAIPLAMVLFGVEAETDSSRLVMAIAALTVVAVLYTLIGGIASVIWTDVLQTIVLVGAAVGAVIVLLHRIPAPIDQIYTALRETDPNGNAKSSIMLVGLAPGSPRWGFNPSQTYTLLTAVFGFSLINMAAYGTDHDLAQRMLTCKSAIRGSRSAWTAILLNVPITMLFMVIGLLLFVYYRRWDLMGGRDALPPLPAGRQAFPNFILSDMPAGLSGLMLAGLFAAGLGSLNSAINAMAATFINDFYMARWRGRSERHYLIAGRWATAGWGLVIGGFAVACIFWMKANPKTTLIDFALGVMTFAYSGLLAVFLGAIFTKRGNTATALAALVTGFLVIVLFQPVVWAHISGVLGREPPATAAGDDLVGGWRLEDLKHQYPWLALAYPWQMLIGTALAFAVCCVGNPTTESVPDADAAAGMAK